MLSITAKVRTLAKELEGMANLCTGLIEGIKVCSKERLTDDIGAFARELPEYKILVQERKAAIELIRKVCTQELSKEKAIELLEIARAELVDTRALIKL